MLLFSLFQLEACPRTECCCSLYFSWKHVLGLRMLLFSLFQLEACPRTECCCSLYFSWKHVLGLNAAVLSTVVPATRGHCRFGAKVSLRGRWSLVAGGPSWQVVPRGRDSNFDTNIYGHTSSAHIVFPLLMHKQNRSGGYENREIPIT